ncbi:hypothetical protein OROGR_017641 [Orobanche gracilis]
MSVANLYNDIREFLSATGLPENHVPTLKELSHYGRQDLANVVRRRGYKFIRQLLTTSYTANIVGSNIDTECVPERFCQSYIASESDTLSLQEKVAKFIQHGELDSIKERTISSSDGEVFRENYFSTKEQTSIRGGKNLKDEAEIRRLKFFLHQNELELTQLKEQIENEKQVFSLLQTKVETEISKAQNLISQKDSELHDAEETLSGLKEVEIEYSGDGATVELAGSFNGWGHKITMDLQPSSSVTDPNRSRTSRLWQAVLWLYPGVYEIKFIIDGHWTIDPLRESISWNGFENNILRVNG